MNLYTNPIMLSSFANIILDSFSDIVQNPVSIIIFCILFVLIISLILATMFETWRTSLVKVKILEENERPSSLLFWIIGIIILVKLIQGFLIQPFIVDGNSMLPTYHNGEFLLVDKFTYITHEAHRGDIMIFKLYENSNNPYEGKHLIKRVIGLPGERVVVKNSVTTIYNKANPSGFVLDESFVVNKESTKNVDVTLDGHHYFVMGDNRAQSYDSRDWGPLDEANIKGQVLLRIYPFSTFSYEPGRDIYNK